MENPFKTIEKRLDQIELSLNDLHRVKNSKVNEEPEILDVSEAAKFLGLAQGTIYNMAGQCKIPSYKEFGRRYFFKSELIEWIKSGKTKTSEEIEKDVYKRLHNLNSNRDE
jgi:excisionase family DNA binding protein